MCGLLEAECCDSPQILPSTLNGPVNLFFRRSVKTLYSGHQPRLLASSDRRCWSLRNCISLTSQILLILPHGSRTLKCTLNLPSTHECNCITSDMEIWLQVFDRHHHFLQFVEGPIKHVGKLLSLLHKECITSSLNKCNFYTRNRHLVTCNTPHSILARFSYQWRNVRL